MRTSILRLLAATALVALGTSRSDAAFLLTNSRGWYDSNGNNSPTNDNYITGQLGTSSFRDFFVFDVSGVASPVAAASFNAFNPSDGFASPDGSETFALYDITTPISNLTTGTGGVAAFIDLGTGVSYGTLSVSSVDNGTTISVNLNAQGLTALNTARTGSGVFAFGGAITTLGGSQSEYLFAFSGSGLPGDGSTFLDLQFGETGPVATPLPPTLLAGFLGMTVLAGVRRFRRA